MLYVAGCTRPLAAKALQLHLLLRSGATDESAQPLLLA
jgi:hypothetical protein